MGRRGWLYCTDAPRFTEKGLRETALPKPPESRRAYLCILYPILFYEYIMQFYQVGKTEMRAKKSGANVQSKLKRRSVCG